MIAARIDLRADKTGAQSIERSHALCIEYNEEAGIRVDLHQSEEGAATLSDVFI